MSENFAKQLLQQRSEFLQHLNNDIDKTNELIDKTQNQINNLNTTIDNIEELAKKIEHIALIPLGKRIYIDGILKHTNQYFIDQSAYPNSYTIEQTSENTIKLLHGRIKQQQTILVKCEQSKEQLAKRIELITGGNHTATNTDDDGDKDRPTEIVTDRGIAVQVGEFYEIVEFE